VVGNFDGCRLFAGESARAEVDGCVDLGATESRGHTMVTVSCLSKSDCGSLNMLVRYIVGGLCKYGWSMFIQSGWSLIACDRGGVGAVLGGVSLRFTCV